MHVRRGLVDAPWMNEELPPVGASVGGLGVGLRLEEAAPNDPDVPGDAESTAIDPDEAACSNCRQCTVFGNCADPVAAGLATQFMLVAHPANGKGCAAHVPTRPRQVSYVRAHSDAGRQDWAFCPPLPPGRLEARFPDAWRIERIDAEDFLG